MQIVSAQPYLTREERKALLQKNDARAAFEVAIHWAWIVAAFVLVYWWTNPLTIIIALFILGGKQLACAILMHDSGHLSVFKKAVVNDFVGQWLGAYPIFHNMLNYRPYHRLHHTTTGLEEDPDLFLTRSYPTSKKSMFRKFFRDLTGITGIKSFVGLIMMNLGYLEYNLGGKITKVNQEDRTSFDVFKSFSENLLKPIIANLILFALVAFFLSPWLYLLWLVAYLTTFQFSLRVRSMAEHSMLGEDSSDPYKNTRTTLANALERLLFAPYHVNFHAEHHMLMGVPSYNLPKMHRLLRERGFYEKGVLEKNYWEVLKLAIQQ